MIREYGDEMTGAKGFTDSPDKVASIILTPSEVTKKITKRDKIYNNSF